MNDLTVNEDTNGSILGRGEGGSAARPRQDDGSLTHGDPSFDRSIDSWQRKVQEFMANIKPVFSTWDDPIPGLDFGLAEVPD